MYTIDKTDRSGFFTVQEGYVRGEDHRMQNDFPNG
jgi:hypothetical protein